MALNCIETYTWLLGKKCPQPDSEYDIPPIALTAIVSKVPEDFFVFWMIEGIRHQIDPQKYEILGLKNLLPFGSYP